MQPAGDSEQAANTERQLIAAARRDSAVVAHALTPVTPPGMTVPGHTLIRELGHGGMGVVYEARQQNPDRAVALKMIRGGALASDNQVMLFEREVRTLAHLKHPGIAAIFEAGRTDDGRHFFAMELVRGRPLSEFARHRQLSRPEQLRLFLRICDAVHYAHQRGVIHRDLKPANILVDAAGNPKILDYGLARIGTSEGAVSTASIEVGKIMGTLPYMSPEQARVTPDRVPEIDIRADVYSLGVILYELLTGHLPYDVSRLTPVQAMRVICEQAPRRPSAVDRALRGELEQIILKTLAKESRNRYDGVADLIADIENYLAGKPVSVHPPTIAYLLIKLAARNRMATVFFGVLLVMVVTFILTLRAQASYHEMIAQAREPAHEASRLREANLRQRFADQRADQFRANALMHQGRFAEAQPLLGAIHGLRGNEYGQLHHLAAGAGVQLAECLAELARAEADPVARQAYLAEAESLLLQGYAVLGDTFGVDSPEATDVAARIDALYQIPGFTDGADWRQNLPPTTQLGQE